MRLPTTRKLEAQIRAYVGALPIAATLLALGIFASATTSSAKAATSPAGSVSMATPRLATPHRVPGLFPGAGYELGGSRVVRDLQRLLTRAGYQPGPVDGRYGPLTEAATRRFQLDHGLQADGIAGRQTLSALNANGLVVLPGAGSEPGGSRLVRDLQQALTRSGDAPGPIDGVYGARTEAAVRAFQLAHGLRVDGVAAGPILADLRGRPPTPRTVVPGAPAYPPLVRTSPIRPAPASPRLSGPAHRPTTPGHPAPAAPRVSAPLGSPARAPTVLSKPTLMPAAPSLPQAGHLPVFHVTPPGGPVPLGTIVLVALAGAALLITGIAFARRGRGDDRARAAHPRRKSPPAPGSTKNGSSRNGVPDHSDADTAFSLGVLLEEQGDLMAAEAAYARADDHGHAAAASNLGVLLEARGDLAGAEAAYRRADDRREANGAFNLGVLLEEQHDYEGAEAAYRRADGRGHAAAASNLGVLLESQGDRIGAEAAYRRADQRGEANGAFNLAVLLEEQGDLAGAEPAYRRADQTGEAKVAQLARAALLDLGSAPKLAAASPRRET